MDNTEDPFEDDLIDKVTQNPLAILFASLGVDKHLFPGAGLTLLNSISWLNVKYGKKFISHLSKEAKSRNDDVTEKDLQNEDFMNIFLKALKYAIDSRNGEKVKLFANIAVEAKDDISFCVSDDPEEYMQIIAEMSEQEMQLLHMLWLYQYSRIREQTSATSEPQKNDIGNRYWRSFCEAATTQFKQHEGMIASRLTRLLRTGCILYDPHANDGNGKFTYEVTSLYHELIKRVKSKAAVSENQ